MRWRDIRFEKPTEKDGLILVKLHDGTERIWHWDMHAESRLKCWIPTSELPQPDLPGEIPGGWRAVDKAVDKRDPKVLYRFWHKGKQEYVDSALSDQWFDDDCYIVPIDPPGPIPDGWRPADKAVDKKRTDEMFWLNGAWRPTKRDDTWDSGTAYIVPIEPPAPQYRPFANAAEFMPHAARQWRYKSSHVIVSPASFSSDAHNCDKWQASMDEKEFVDLIDGKIVASPFGVLITEGTQ